MYQSSSGGRVWVPLEDRARIIGGNSTPRFAKMVSWKYGQMCGASVEEDFVHNHRRSLSRKQIQLLSQEVAQLVADKEFHWEYELPQFEEVISHISVSRDGTTTAIRQDGWRETMCGTISFYNAQGDRLHTIYKACAPEAGKATFDEVMNLEVEQVKKHFPQATYVGLADGAKANWTYLEGHCSVNILDFFHASEYLTLISPLMAGAKQTAEEWLSEACQNLKHKRNGAKWLLREMKYERARKKPAEQVTLDKAVSYFENNLHRMNYAQYLKKGYPIGSGVTEAACKVLVKQRLCCSGMRWSIDSVQNILLLRELILTSGRWEQFWSMVDRWGT